MLESGMNRMFPLNREFTQGEIVSLSIQFEPQVAACNNSKLSEAIWKTFEENKVKGR